MKVALTLGYWAGDTDAGKGFQYIRGTTNDAELGTLSRLR
mgnify:CR=1 FL=1